jgi:hypothetical protein
MVRLPLFETASSTVPVEVEALISITPGMFNNLFVGDVVFVAFEENALEKPIVIGKLYTGAAIENNTPGGAGILDTLLVRTSGTMPAENTTFVFHGDNEKEYDNFKTPKKIADYIKWLEKYANKLFKQIDSNFRCFKSWVQWQLQPENVEIDDGDIDDNYHITEPLLYQQEGKECRICGDDCLSNKKSNRCYLNAEIKNYPNT